MPIRMTIIKKKKKSTHTHNKKQKLTRVVEDAQKFETVGGKMK